MRFIDKYISEKSIEIHTAIAGRKIIYLDLKYWIILRDGLGQGNDTVARKVARKILELYESGKCIFPVSEAVFWEILKQEDKISLIKTFQLAERLSEGIAILSDKQRVKVEFACWYSINAKTDDLPVLEKLVWSKLPLISGYFFYSLKVEELPDNLKGAFLDFVCQIPMSTLIDQAEYLIPFSGKDNVEEMNRNKEKYQYENKSRKAMFLSELWGVLDCFTDQFNEVVADMYQKTTRFRPTEKELINTDKTAWQKLIYQAFKMEKITNQLPTLKIIPALTGAMRWNTNRRYTDGNDTIDIMHATIALPYCDYFFTEKELHTIITQDKLDDIFQCITESKPECVLERLTQL